MQKSSGFGIGTRGRSGWPVSVGFRGLWRMGFLHSGISIRQMLPSGYGSPPTAERPICHLSPGATPGGR